ncbi:MAG: porphobilinogen synthase [Opitutales bacterium]|nr:porphobilinogen synthase [Opitutales bacterium]
MMENLRHRSRRLRYSPSVRNLAREGQVTPADLIAPLFVFEGEGPPQPVPSLPGVSRFSLPNLLEEIKELQQLGIPGIALFPCLPAERKDPLGKEALNPETLVLRTIRAIKKTFPTMAVFTDIALDPYTTHGHDGLLNADNTDVENDRTVEVLSKMAVLHAEAGVDMVAPSDMMDGRVAAIRQALDAAGHTKTGILAYSAKFASSFYGPFRDAVGSRQAGNAPPINKQTYQADPANRRAAIQDALLDEKEGADILMVKPAGPYLDVLTELRQNTRLPLAAYQVSGEYAMLQAAAEKGWLELKSARNESLLAIKRAGADMILTYFAKNYAKEY